MKWEGTWRTVRRQEVGKHGEGKEGSTPIEVVEGSNHKRATEGFGVGGGWGKVHAILSCRSSAEVELTCQEQPSSA